MENKRKIGSAYEEEAALCLKKRGWILLEKNFRCKCGEIDLILKDGEYLVFAEVKYRKKTVSGYGQEAVGKKKQSRILKTALWYLKLHHYPDDTPCRFDVISFLGNTIQIIENAFEYERG